MMVSQNQTQFILLGFPSLTKIQTSIFLLLVSVYILTLFGNMIIMFAVCHNNHLQAPMYYFLSSLASLDIFFSSTTVPKLLTIMLYKNGEISLIGCLLQFYFYYSLGGTEFFLLGLMSVDRYLAICHPLRYNIMMTSYLCWRLITTFWIFGFLQFMPAVFQLTQQQWCGKTTTINHFFCDGSALLKLSCSDKNLAELLVNIFSSFSIISAFIPTLISYCCILSRIFAIASHEGRKKTFSTCSSHFIVVLIAYGSCIFIYIRPAGTKSSNVEKNVAILNSICIPLLNPCIYTLRNQMVKKTLKSLCTGSRISN